MSSHPLRPSLETLEPRLLMSAASHAPELWPYGATVSANSLTTDTPTDTPAVTLDWAARIRNIDSAPIAIDSAGNTFIVGQQIIKLSPAGDRLWAIDFHDVTGAYINDIAIDHDGNLLITGQTFDPLSFISGGFDTAYDSSRTGFVFKLDANGEHLWSTYLRGQGDAIAVDNQGNILVTGFSSSAGWTTLGYDTSFGGGTDAFVIKLSPAGDHLWSTYLGGTEYERGNDIAADAAGNILVTGYTASPNWVAGGYNLSLNGVQDAFVAKLSPTGAHLWSTYHGDARNDSGDALAIDHDSNIVVAGDIRFLVPYEPGYGQVKYDPFVLKLDSAGQKLWDKTFGGSEDEYVSDVAIDTANNILIVGSTRSGDWTANGLDNTFGGRSDAYVLKLNSLGSTLWSTYLGGDLTDLGRSIALDPHGGIIVLGKTTSIPTVIAAEPLPGYGDGGGMYTRGSYNDIGLEIVVQSLAFAPPANIQSSLTDYQGAFSPSGDFNLDVFVLRLTEPSTIPCPGDFNLDGQVNVQDINPFLLAMTNLPAYQQQYPDAVLALIDPNADGLINAQDLNALTARLVGQTVPFTGGANLFDEAFYLQYNPDVAGLVGPGYTYATAFDHFTAVGQFEGRQPNTFFNESFYLAQNPDVAIAVAQGHFSSGFEHFARHGQTEARDFSKLFDERFYLANNPDVASGVAANLWRSGFEHFIVQGYLESRRIIPLFDEQTYLTHNPDVAADTGPGKIWSSGFDHFLAAGQFESRRFSPYFFETAYLLNNPDIAADVGPGKMFTTGLHHYIVFGQYEGRIAV